MGLLEFSRLPNEIRQQVTRGALELHPSYRLRLTRCTCGGESRGHTDNCGMVEAGDEFSELLGSLELVDLKRYAHVGVLVLDLMAYGDENQRKQVRRLIESARRDGQDVYPVHRPWLSEFPEINASDEWLEKVQAELASAIGFPVSALRPELGE
jgi:hypothetical protein